MSGPNRSSSDRGSKDAGQRGVRLALGEANVPLLFQQLEAEPESYRSCLDAFLEELRAQPTSRARWSDALAGAVEARLPSVPDMAATGERHAVEYAAKDWAKEANAFAALETRDVFLFGDEITQPLELLIRVDAKRGLSTVDKLPYPALMRDVLFGVRDDPQLVMATVAKSPLVFNDASWCPGQPVAALVSLANALQHASALCESMPQGASAQAGDEGSLPASEHEDTLANEWTRKVAAELLARPDGYRLATGYLAHVLRWYMVRDAQPGQEARRRRELAIASSLASAIRDAGPRSEVARSIWRQAEDAAEERRVRRVPSVARRPADARYSTAEENENRLRTYGLPHLLGWVLVLPEEASADDADQVVEWLEELFNGLDPGLGLAEHGLGWSLAPRLLGCFLAMHRSGGERIRGLYESLEPQRRRGSLEREVDRDSTRASILALRVALYLALTMAEKPTWLTEARSVLSWAFESARRLWLTSPPWSDHGPVVSNCFSFAAKVASEEDLQNMLGSLVGSGAVLLDACDALRQNGKTPDEIGKMSLDACVDLDAEYRAALLWASHEVDGRSRTRLRRIAADLRLDT